MISRSDKAHKLIDTDSMSIVAMKSCLKWQRKIIIPQKILPCKNFENFNFAQQEIKPSRFWKPVLEWIVYN